MTDLIRREDALEAIKNAELGQEYDEVENVPSVDAVPVDFIVSMKHRLIEDGQEEPYITAGCGIAAAALDFLVAKYNDCGARMDGGKDDI